MAIGFCTRGRLRALGTELLWTYPFHLIPRPLLRSRASGGFLRSIPFCGTRARSRPCLGSLASPPHPVRWEASCGRRRYPTGRPSISRTVPSRSVCRCRQHALGYGDDRRYRAVLLWPCDIYVSKRSASARATLLLPSPTPLPQYSHSMILRPTRTPPALP